MLRRQHFRLLCLYAWRKRKVYATQKYTDLKVVYWQHHAGLGAPSLIHNMYGLGYGMNERSVGSGRMLRKPGLRSVSIKYLKKVLYLFF